jgi:hypothetical protein
MVRHASLFSQLVVLFNRGQFHGLNRENELMCLYLFVITNSLCRLRIILDSSGSSH